MSKTKFLRIARGPRRKILRLLPQMANRHGLVTGATGTGKTVTLQVMAEEFSRLGVPVFLADVKGDLSGLAQAGEVTPGLQRRLEKLKITDYAPQASPVTFFDIDGLQGHPSRTTTTAMGPLLLSRLLNLNSTQQGVMSVIFQVAKDNCLPMETILNLQNALRFCSENSNSFQMTYGRATQASLGSIQRALLLFREDTTKIFGPPQFDIRDLVRAGMDGRGIISILSADKLIRQPRTYSTFLLWLLTELFNVFPEVGDTEKPRLAFFFDEAHLLFLDAPQVLLEKIEQVVRLIRSKGVGIYFVTQNPVDVPEAILSQLGNRVQHALRAFTPKDHKAVRLAATTFRENPNVDVEKAITELGTGEALVSFLDKNGHPTPVERAFIFPPRSRIGVLDEQRRMSIIEDSVLLRKYREEIVPIETALPQLAQEEERDVSDHGGLAVGFLWDSFMEGLFGKKRNKKRR